MMVQIYNPRRRLEASLGYIARPFKKRERERKNERKENSFGKYSSTRPPQQKPCFNPQQSSGRRYLFTSSLIVSGSVGETVSWVVKTEVSVREGFMAADSGKPWVGRKKRLNTNTKQDREMRLLPSRPASNVRSQTVKQPREGLRNMRGDFTGHP